MRRSQSKARHALPLLTSLGKDNKIRAARSKLQGRPAICNIATKGAAMALNHQELVGACQQGAMHAKLQQVALGTAGDSWARAWGRS
eukprot:1153818-Pelagomonas_calceolata.AAC.4